MRCPMCKKDIDSRAVREFRPFCSPACKKLDLANWLDGKYSLPRELAAEEIDALPTEERELVFKRLLERS